MPRCAGYFPLQPSACVVWATMDVLLCTASIWHMCTMSLDRYCTLRYPISYGRSRTRTSVALKIAFVWVVSTAVCVALAIAGFANYSNVYVDGQCVPAVKDFVLYGSILAFYVPLLIMVVTYVLTVRILAENRRTMASIGLHITAGGNKLTGDGDWIARKHYKWDGPPASLDGSALRQTDGGPLAGRYRRHSTVEWKPRYADKTRRKGVDDQSCVSSSVTVLRDRNRTEHDPTTAIDNEGGKDLSSSGPFNDCRDHAQPQPPSAAKFSRRSTASPPSMPSDEPDPSVDTHLDDVPHLCLAALFRAGARDLPRDGSDQFAPGQSSESLLQSDRLNAPASHFVEAALSDIPRRRVVENVNDNRRRLSDGALLDYEQIPAYRASTWSLLQRPSSSKLSNTTTAYLERTPLTTKHGRSTVGARTGNSTFTTDASMSCSDRLMNCSRWNGTLSSDEESSVQLIACTQRHSWRPQRYSVDSGTFNKSTTTDGDRSTVWSLTTRTTSRVADRVSQFDEMSRRTGVETTVGKVVVGRTTAKWTVTDTTSMSQDRLLGHLSDV